MQANYAYICPNQFTVDEDCDLIAANCPKFEDIESPSEALATAQKLANLTAKPVVVTPWERDRSYHNRGELDPVTVQPCPFWVA